MCQVFPYRQTHLWSAHGEASDERLYMTSVTCDACHKFFWTVNRLQIHLRSSRAHPGGCYERLTWTSPPLQAACPIEDLDCALHHHRLPAVPVPTVSTWAACPDRAVADRQWQEAWLAAGITFEIDDLTQRGFFSLFDGVMANLRSHDGVDPDPLLWALTECAGNDSQCDAPEGAGVWAFALWALDSFVYDRFAHLDPIFFERCARAVLDAVQQLPLDAWYVGNGAWVRLIALMLWLMMLVPAPLPLRMRLFRTRSLCNIISWTRFS